MAADVKFRQEGSVAFATLDNPQQINALTLQMVELLTRQLEQWETDPRVHCVVLDGEGDRGFCAGGDVRRVAQIGLDGKNPYAIAFFESEYRLDYLIHSFKKPIMVWGNGIVMGGGLGLMMGAKARVITENTTVAMPELQIGFVPDVGATYFLNQKNHKIGLFLALTSTRLNAADTLFMGWADFLIASKNKEEIFAKLPSFAWTADAFSNEAVLVEALSQYSTPRSQIEAGPLEQHAPLIQKEIMPETFKDFFSSLRHLAISDSWFASALESLLRGSPTSANLIYEQLKRGRDFDLKRAFKLELILVLQCIRHTDFYEGVRAVLIDKDGHARWKPAVWEGITTDLIDEHFAPPWKGPHPLENLGERLG